MTWDELIKIELEKPYFQQLVTFLKEEDHKHLVLPPKEKRLSCFKLTPYDEVKVVIIGQDPYHNLGQAHGLSFSVEQGVYPPSLKNIYQEYVDDLNLPYPTTGNLSSWAKQGVLLLNTVLTVVAHQPMSHQKKGWETFTLEVVKKINEKQNPVVFILWGAHAQSFIPYINSQKHFILKAPHPSPLSSHRGFFGSKPFSKTNHFLISKGIEPIDWKL
ncbi:MAG: uracil-DNA glycosylase [Tenericutes bacterium GWC2_34_14]|nr:MAG: uracil-DNA glycosylase [Tenericutes bacterium GWA2_35_7]OHE29705.1 MAG: uracil-DNA glycosylase [Tenericutes bacterium GWC2_34_14]OHE34684.1 MAG: uracil-DNA glycosylase [Tenericutes bacterium GWE2_34_108]OHE37455.1 MAG: uracil-DNA glycosylase [Tenericutes bacterium GWF1_35_14]OHE39410.1 MAG: uracil-DNA glycosylase [Tenericutes bacterium GWF2_35_184]OHE43633.1 MAG: uracil-DNA glycosylase [Tenericutes bacterium RIFOXYA12_FULL_35_10]OHE44400.1 MAG: uracil-DNA glycosylase [Tenericutes bact